LHLSIVGNYLLFDVRDPETYQPIVAHYLSLSPFRGLIRDYFRVREHYFEAIKSAKPHQIEAVDMGRRGLHNEAADFLLTRLKNKLEMDHFTARRLFTLICAIQPYATRKTEAESGLPTVLFICSMNSVRSPIAAALARRLYSNNLIARSAGVRSGKADGFVHEVMQEIGIDMSVHTPHTMDELVSSHFDLIITLSNDAKKAVETSRLEADKIEHWPTIDPTIVEGNRDLKLSAYKDLRIDLEGRIKSLNISGSQTS
jgi:protein-tyrosine-phosphatase